MRSSGIILHISSLRGKFAIGTLGREAFEFIDFLAESSVKYWQVLPLGHTGFGDSPYQCFSVFAGNPYFISPQSLFDDGLLEQDELEYAFYDNDTVDYGLVYNISQNTLRKAFKRFTPDDDYNKFVLENSEWLNNYSAFMTIKTVNNGACWYDWDDELRLNVKSKVDDVIENNKAEYEFWRFVQYEFFKQWTAVKDYANSKGIKIIGDVAIYVAYDSADVWSNPKLFLLDDNSTPTSVAGCPPDSFSKDGQLWGNPLYDWNYMKNDGYSWWINRIKHASIMYNTVRLDHFRGFSAFWSVPFGDKTAVNGKWVEGPGYDLFDLISQTVPHLDIIAEDLGLITDDVKILLDKTGYPGMKVLEFAFERGYNSDYLPFNHIKNCVCYTGTHDNDTLIGWLNSMNENNLSYVFRFTHTDNIKSCADAVIDLAWSSCAYLCIVQMQDLLGLDGYSRMNVPSKSSGNWKWRLNKDSLTDEIISKIRVLNETFFR